MTTYIAKFTDLFGIFTSAHLAIYSHSIIMSHAHHIGLLASTYAGGAYITLYGLIAFALYGFYRSLCYVSHLSVNPMSPWSGWRLLAWPTLALVLGVANLLQNSIG